MGDIAEMILDGILDERTGEYLGRGGGYPRSIHGNNNRSFGGSKKYKSSWFRENQLPHIQKLYEVKEFNPNSFRIKGENFTVDYYPKSQKLFRHDTKAWLSHIDKPLRFINKTYGKKELVSDGKPVPCKVVKPIQNERLRPYLELIIHCVKKAEEELLECTDKRHKADIMQRIELNKKWYIRANQTEEYYQQLKEYQIKNPTKNLVIQD